VIQISKSAPFDGGTGAAEADRHPPDFKVQKRHARICPSTSACYPPRRPVVTRPGVHEMEAFLEMVVASRSKFIAMANTILRNKEDAEDAVQDAFLSGYLHLPSFEGRSALTTWFTRIVMNAALMIRRKRKSVCMNSLLETSTLDEARPMERIRATLPDPEMVYAERETIQFINEALEKMTPGLRQAFNMTYYDEISGPEAGALLGVSSAAFKSRLLRARRLLNKAQRTRVARSARTVPPHWSDSNQRQVNRGSENGDRPSIGLPH